MENIVYNYTFLFLMTNLKCIYKTKKE
uniref:Uncharacterized protein n=1 Tax=Heterorhabditis bacteriophora TaxID=37862 RepID=A0A1I7WEW4_HETBA